jgi:hypothetical protein
MPLLFYSLLININIQQVLYQFDNNKQIKLILNTIVPSVAPLNAKQPRLTVILMLGTVRNILKSRNQR